MKKTKFVQMLEANKMKRLGIVVKKEEEEKPKKKAIKKKKK